MESTYPAWSRFDAKIKVLANGCWKWTGCKNQYGRFSINGRTEYAHRVSWFFYHGEWPTKFVCHSCDFSFCVNPDHLFEGTSADNTRDAARKGRMTGPRRVNANRDEVRAMLAKGWSQREVAEEFGISQATVSECSRFEHEPR